jgi:hypothetical protein
MMSMISLTLASHPIQMLLAVITLYHAGTELLGRRNPARYQAAEGTATVIFRDAA